MDTQQERQLSTNWTGSYIENPLPGDFTYEWKDNEVIITNGISNFTHCEGTWESKAFSASAAYICQNRGDILQIGYGMCQMANYIQSHPINSHTIIIDQQQAYEHALEWVQDKSNVTIITGSFYEKTLPQYDGVFINKTKLLYCNENTAKIQIKNYIPNFTKIGSLISWYNYLNSETNMFNIDDIEYQHIELEESPPSNYIYGSDKNYYVPKMKIT